MKIQKSLTGFLFATYLALFLGVGFFLSRAYAQEDADVAAKYGVTFPIAELGNCKNLSSCRTFCEDPVNQAVCIEFAKSKGFYKEDPVQTSKEEILAAARSELGCDSYDSCMSFCQDSSNFDKCDVFAKRHNLTGGHTQNPEEQEFLAKAKEALGCDSPTSCMNFCDNPSNRDKCSEFAKQVGIRGGHMEVGPGGCNSEETCRAFCSNPQNYEICSSYGKASGESFSGPGGCNSEESCRAYCTEHPRECGLEQKGDSYSYPVYNEQEMCSKTPDCSWNNNRCECIQRGTEYKGDPQDYCRQYPEKCTYDTSGAAEQCAKYPGCRWENNTCQCSQGDVQTQSIPTSSYDPASECTKHPGCSWTGSSCQCSSQDSGTQNYQPSSGGNYDPATECAKTSGCSWTGSTCQCSSQNSPENYTLPSDSGSGSYTQPSDSGSYTTPSSGVQGAKAENGVLFMLLDFLKNLFN